MLPQARQFLITTRTAEASRRETLAHLHSNGIYPEVCYGYDYRKTALVTLNYERTIYDDGSIWRIGEPQTNCYLSHYSLWQACNLMSDDAYVIYEDDVRVKSNWHKTMVSVNANLPPDWDILYLGSCCGQTGLEVATSTLPIYKVTHCLCTHAYAVRKKLLPFLLETLETIDTHLDIAMCKKVLPKVNAYAIFPRIAHQSNTKLPL